MKSLKNIFTILGIIALPVAGYAADKPPEQIFRANCSTCHSENGEGGRSWIDPSVRATQISGRSPSLLKKWVRAGRLPQMPAFGINEINDTELDALANYVNKLPGSYIAPPVAQYTVTITDQDPWYNDKQVQVNVGDTVKFINTGKTYHPVTQIEFVASKGTDPTATDSGMLGPNGSYYRTFDQTGKYTFLCKIHPYMRGEIWVGQTPTAPTATVHAPMSTPSTKGVGEVWVLAQFQDQSEAGGLANKDGVIQVIDATTWNVTHTIPAGNNPHNLMFTPDNKTAWATNWFDNTLTEINANTKTVVKDHIIGASPAHLMNAMGDSKFYVTMEGSNYVQQWDSARKRRGATGTVSGAGPHGNWVAGNKIITSNSIDSTVSFLDQGTLTEINNLPADLYPLGASLDSMGMKGYAGNCLSGSVSIYDTFGTPSKFGDTSIGGCPVQVPVSPDDRYVVVPNSPNTTILYNNDNPSTTNINEWGTIAAQFFTGKGAHGAAFGPKQGGGWYAYITHKYEDYVSVIDMDSLTHVGDIALKRPLGSPAKVSIAGATNTGGNGITTRY